ncbi:MAG: ABC transporter substrate-binding protein [Candidatus Dormiibacterota bacterium]|jgi:peptide/nickel transport system substrate-binding protein
MNLGKIAVLAAGVALGVAACGSTSSTTSPSSSTGTTAVGPTLYEEATTGTTFVQDFNPYDSSSLAHGLNMTSLVYEPLYEMDALNPTPSGMHPWMATAYSFGTGGTTLNITVRSGVKFSDGTTMTANDVANTFAVIKAFPAADYSGVPAQSAAPTVSGSKVTLTFATPQYTNLWSILGSTFITQASAFPATTDPSKETIATPVGTGPFMLDSFSTQAVKFKPNPYFFEGKPPESEIVVPNEATNNAATEALDNGTLDWAGNDIPSVVANYIDLNPNTNHVWFASGNTVTLDFNLASGNGGATGIDDQAVRQAVSLGIDRGVLSSIGESGYEAAATSAGGLLPTQQTAYPDSTYANDLPADSAATSSSAPAGWSGPTVQSVLEADGWTPPAGWGTSSEANCTDATPTACWTKGSETIKFSIWDPEAFSDYWADAQEISSQLQAEGMNVTTDNASGGYSQWQDAMNVGNFQTALHWGNGGNIPFVQLDNWLDYSVNCTAALNCAAGDYAEFQSSAAQTAIQQYEGADPTTSAGQATIASAIQTLEGIMATDVPYAPVLYGADWNVYSTLHYTGWPSASNPYMDPSPDDPEIPYILMQLKPVTS